MYIEAFTHSSHAHGPGDPNNTSHLPAASSRTAGAVGTAGRRNISRAAAGRGTSACLGPARGSTVVTSSRRLPPTAGEICYLKCNKITEVAKEHNTCLIRNWIGRKISYYHTFGKGRNLHPVGLICLEACRRGLQNEILASHFEDAFEFPVHLYIKVWTFSYCQLVTPQGSLWSGAPPWACPGNLFLASRSLTCTLSPSVAGTSVNHTRYSPVVLFLLVVVFFFFLC